MCRWLAYTGNPIRPRLLLFDPEHALVTQSYDARRAETHTHGDGFGVGWYGANDTPALYRSILPAWNDANLRELAMAVNDELFTHIRGTTDSEMMFFLALSLGLDEDPLGALQRMVGVVERAGRREGVEDVLQMTVALSDGDSIWAVRYATRGTPRTLYHSLEMKALYELVPELEEYYAADSRVVVSEPLSDLDEAWEEIPASSAVRIHQGNVEVFDFAPIRPES